MLEENVRIAGKKGRGRRLHVGFECSGLGCELWKAMVPSILVDFVHVVHATPVSLTIKRGFHNF